MLESPRQSKNINRQFPPPGSSSAFGPYITASAIGIFQSTKGTMSQMIRNHLFFASVIVAKTKTVIFLTDILSPYYAIFSSSSIINFNHSMLSIPQTPLLRTNRTHRQITSQNLAITLSGCIPVLFWYLPNFITIHTHYKPISW